MKRGNARLFTLLAVIIVLSLVVDLLSLKTLYNISESKSDLSGELASLWGGDPLEKINPNITNPQCSSYNSTYKSGCLNTGYCFCNDF
ncbi:MAG: hypothetical protein Q8N63_04575, partial [Nanoarchaeota archaeon]|nr:hypothetical protein [Nanoarchaeota archaeon]